MKTPETFPALLAGQKAFALTSLRRLAAHGESAEADGDWETLEKVWALRRQWLQLLWELM